MAVLTGLGLVFTAFLIGILTNALSVRLETMRKGRSWVATEGHTVILGWSPHVFTTVAELLEANANHPGRTVAVLAPRDKVEMEDSLRARAHPPGLSQRAADGPHRPLHRQSLRRQGGDHAGPLSEGLSR
jgi:hypothetical protein